MSRTTTMTVRPSGALREFVAATVSETIRDLIRRDRERAELIAFERLKAGLTQAFAAPEANDHPLTAAAVIARNQV